MNKIKLILLSSVLLINGCTKEVYLQPVPCETECKPCFIGKKEYCPETDIMTERQVYQVEDVEKPKVDYTYLENGNIRRCKHTCHQEKVE